MAESAPTRRLFVCLAAVATALACLPAAAAGYGADLPEDDTTAYEFGWSADRQTSGGNPLPITIQFLRDGQLGEMETEMCITGIVDPPDPSKAQPDGVDVPVRAFRSFTSPGTGFPDPVEPRVQITTASFIHNKRLIGTDLHDARRENSATIGSQESGMHSSERRPCPASTATWADPSPDMIFYGQHHKNTATNLRSNLPTDFDDNEWIASPYYVPAEGQGLCAGARGAEGELSGSGQRDSMTPTAPFDRFGHCAGMLVGLDDLRRVNRRVELPQRASADPGCRRARMPLRTRSARATCTTIS